MITPIVKFLIKLSSKSEPKLITIPKIISIINNLLANNNIRGIAVQALRTLSYEIFLMTTNNSTTSVTQQERQHLEQNIQSSPIITAKKRSLNDPHSLASIAEHLSALNNNELDTQKEVILGMLEKFIESNDCQQVLSLLLLIEQLQQQYEQYKVLNDANKVTTATITASKTIGKATIGDTCIDKQQQVQHNTEKYSTCLPSVDIVCNMICHSICSNRLHIKDWNDFYLLDTFFKNNTKYILGNSKEFMALLKYFMEGVSLKLIFFLFFFSRNTFLRNENAQIKVLKLKT